MIVLSYYNCQKHPPLGVLRKGCFENMQQIYRRTPMPTCDFDKIAKQLYRYYTSAWVFSCKFFCIVSEHHFLRKPLEAASELLKAANRGVL